MKTFALALWAFFMFQLMTAQIIEEDFNSKFLQDSRKLRISLPKSYKTNPDKLYPLVLTLDGDYLFDPISGNVTYMSFWENMPETIVVGIDQSENRQRDCQYDSNTQLPEYEGRKFYYFIEQELIGYLQKNFRLAKFKMIVGQDYTSNFINYFIRDESVFQAYVNLSPDYANKMLNELPRILDNTSGVIWYYLATADNDVKDLRTNVVMMNDELSKLKNENLNYIFDDFEEQDHYSLVNFAIPSALRKIFSFYRPISRKEYNEQIIDSELSPYEYLIEKYSTIENLIGIKQRVRVNDFIAISTALESKEDWEGLKKLGDLARKVYPEYMLGNYYLGTYYENIGKAREAMKIYKNGHLLREISFLTKDIMLEKAQRIKEDFGW